MNYYPRFIWHTIENSLVEILDSSSSGETNSFPIICNLYSSVIFCNQRSCDSLHERNKVLWKSTLLRYGSMTLHKIWFFNDIVTFSEILHLNILNNKIVIAFVCCGKIINRINLYLFQNIIVSENKK